MRARTLLLAVALLLVAPGVARAAVAPGDYGGGAFQPPIKPRFVGHGSSLAWARVAPDGRAFVGGRVALKCGTLLFGTDVVPAADGSFRFRRRFGSRTERSVSVATVEGRFDGATATGTVRGRLSVWRGRKERRCTTRGAVTWELRAPGATGAPAPPQPGATYRGTTSQPSNVAPRPFLLRVADDGTQVVGAKFLYKRRCRRRSFLLNDLTPPAPIKADGTFATRERFSIPSKGGVREAYRVRVDGRFTAGGVTGTLRVRTTARRRGRLFDRCDTGPLTFAASL